MRDEPIGPRAELTSLRRFTWWSVTSMTTTVMLVVVVVRLVTSPTAPDASTIWGAGALVVTVLASARLLARRLTWPSPGGSTTAPGRRWHLAGNGAAVVLGGLLLAGGDHEFWAFAPATTVALSATFLPVRRAWSVIVGTAVVLGGTGAAFAPSLEPGPVAAALFPAVLVVSIAALTLGMLWSWDVVERLDESRRLSAELAVKDERLRFAAELHDIQGHHLQVIALKGELAARLVVADPARAIRELEDVQRLAADALQDTRAVVHGYRRTTLHDEIANATRVLEAAGIDTTMHLDPAAVSSAGDLPETAQHLLGLVVREATTNVLRHSRARTAEVTYRTTGRSAQLRVTNDGASASPQPDAGAGLAMLAERLEAAGGTLAYEGRAGRFVLDASLPLGAAPPSAPATARPPATPSETG